VTADEHLRGTTLLTTRITAIDADEAGGLVATWAAGAAGRAVCAANVHMVMEAWDDASFAATLAEADLVVCDGRPLVWASRLLGVHGARQARGLDLMMAVCAQAERCGLKVGLYGGEPAVIQDVRRELALRCPRLEVSYCWSPPFRELTRDEDRAACEAIAQAGPHILFVSLGCPKQERWMLAHRSRLSCVMLGVGAAFDMLGGRVGVAPVWMQRAGLEWVFRLAREPRRLWHRYARHNGRFAALVVRQRLRAGTGGAARPSR
jgi:N-acetylglucosaminyldiphosphoundecaprenol N-acetyl-beta-D-mannosaminyltransferase